MHFSAVILAGGNSSRMGRDKAWLEVHGQTLLARQIQLGRQLGATEIFISGRADTDYSRFGCAVLQDKFVQAGPLAGVEQAFAAATTPMLLVLAVDLPGMHVDFLRRLAAVCSPTCGAIPQLAGQTEPLAAFYPKSAYSLVLSNLECGRLAARDFARQCVAVGLARFIEIEESEARCLRNWNEP